MSICDFRKLSEKKSSLDPNGVVFRNLMVNKIRSGLGILAFKSRGVRSQDFYTSTTTTTTTTTFYFVAKVQIKEA